MAAPQILDLRYDPGVERREHDRYRLWIPVEIDSADGSTWPGVIHDVSERGALAVTAATFKIKVRVTVRFHLPPDSNVERSLEGEIARVGVNGADPDSLWKKAIAVQFDEPIPDLDALIGLSEKLT